MDNISTFKKTLDILVGHNQTFELASYPGRIKLSGNISWMGKDAFVQGHYGPHQFEKLIPIYHTMTVAPNGSIFLVKDGDFINSVKQTFYQKEHAWFWVNPKGLQIETHWIDLTHANLETLTGKISITLGGVTFESDIDPREAYCSRLLDAIRKFQQNPADVILNWAILVELQGRHIK